MVNAGKKPLDVTILLVGADFSITPVWPTDGADNRIAIGEIQNDRPCAECTGPERGPASSGLSWSLCRASASRTLAFDNLGQEGLRDVGRTRTAGLRPQRAPCWRSG